MADEDDIPEGSDKKAPDASDPQAPASNQDAPQAHASQPPEGADEPAQAAEPDPVDAAREPEPEIVDEPEVEQVLFEKSSEPVEPSRPLDETIITAPRDVEPQTPPNAPVEDFSAPDPVYATEPPPPDEPQHQEPQADQHDLPAGLFPRRRRSRRAAT